MNGVCSIIVPSPYVKNNHQYLNAKYLEDNNACVLINESILSCDRLNLEINSLINNSMRRIEIKNNAKKLAILNSKKKIYEDIIKDYEG